MKYLEKILLILILPVLAQAQEIDQETNQGMVNSAATAYGMPPLLGSYPKTTEELAVAAEYDQMAAAGAIDEYRTVDRAFSDVYIKLGSPSGERFSTLIDAYKMSASENKPTAQDVLDAVKALDFGRYFNAGIEASRNSDDGFLLYKTPSLIKKGLKSLLPSRSKSFRRLIESSHARTLIFNHDFADILGIGSKARTVQVQDLISFTMHSKDSRLIKRNAGDAESMSKGFNAVADEADLKLSPVDPGKVVSHYSGTSQADVIIAAVTEHAAKHEDVVYLLAFYGYGRPKYQYFTVSISKGFINITFAADDNRPIPVVITSMPASRVDYSTLATAIDDFMKGKDEVPDLLGIWRISSH
ncbi:hypothetical protein [Endozoicomonas sp. 4G]|uniref:hypothetical protein n=1 Tax=Endozoicomonas sp. 4G TaxID=2872754 RepID=UPI00207870BE|nr:hypothetical protein [Endozoicomonas sp. 4G]